MPTRWINGHQGRSRNPHCAACDKTVFLSEVAAKLALTRMDDARYGGLPRRAYRCPVRWGWWHVTKKSKRPTSRRASG